MLQRSLAVIAVVVIGVSITVACSGGGETSTARSDAGADWHMDPAWYEGKAEWALYDAERPIYGVPRQYEATIYTNKQVMDPKTTTKAANWREPRNVEVFKHNVSEMIETENYTYRFLTTCFVRTDTMRTYKVAASTQEDCGTTYRQFVVADGTVKANEFSYFPDNGASDASYVAPDGLAFHDALTLRLRDYPFDAADKPRWSLELVPDQTDTHAVPLRPTTAMVTYIGRETAEVPYGRVDCHHLRVTHAEDGGTTTSDYWFAADDAMRHVLVRYTGPYGVQYRLKKLAWWAYWDRAQQRPE